MAALGLCCFVQAFSSCSEWRLLSSLRSVAFSVRWRLLLWTVGCGVCGLQELRSRVPECRLSSCGSRHSCLVCAESSWTRDQTCVPCIGRRTPNPWTTREVPILLLISHEREVLVQLSPLWSQQWDLAERQLSPSPSSLWVVNWHPQG